MGAELNEPETTNLAKVVRSATDQGFTVILDPHDKGRYFGEVVGGPKVTAENFADFWRKLAEKFADNSLAWFGLMNEPHDMPGEGTKDDAWANAVRAATVAIRKAGATNMILVPGTNWSHADTYDTKGDYPQILAQIDGENVGDKLTNYAFEVHQYLDDDGSGKHSQVKSPTVGSERIARFTEWCRKHHVKAFLGELAAPGDLDGRRAVQDMLWAMEKDRDVWLAFTWWAAGVKWEPDYMFSLEPKDDRKDRPQMAYLLPHLHRPETAQKHQPARTLPRS